MVKHVIQQSKMVYHNKKGILLLRMFNYRNQNPLTYFEKEVSIKGAYRISRMAKEAKLIAIQPEEWSSIP